MVDRQNFPIPEIINPPRQCICIEIPGTDDHKQVVAGLLWELTQWFNWQRDDAHSGTQLAAVYRDVFNSIDWSDMSCCCNQPTVPVKHRTTQAGAIEISYDDGETWIPDPADPRLSGTALPPPIAPEIGTAKCDAATNGLEHFKDLVASHSNALGTATTAIELILAVAAALVALVFAPEAVPIIVPLLVATVTALFGLGKTAYDAYFTNTVWDIILCIFYCNIDDDGTFSEGGYQQLLIDIGTKLPAGVPRDMCYRDFIAMGQLGLNNICSYGSAADADCTSCDCTLCVQKFNVPGDSIYGKKSTDQSGLQPNQVRFETDAINTNNNYYVIVISNANDSGCLLKQAIDTPDGGVGVTAYMLVGGNRTDYGNYTIGSPNANSACVNGLLFSSGAAFSIVLEFADC